MILHSEELCDFHISTITDITGTVKSRRLCWTGHMARIGVTRIKYKILVDKSQR
jgi:hypothetical protein